MNAFDRGRARTRARAQAGLALALAATLLLLQGTARGDIGFESASRSSAAPGEQVRVTIGCGFCFPPCVGRPGHRHPPASLDGVCMLGGRPGPPRWFGIWLTPSAHPLARNPLGSSRPPHLPSFTYLGRAERAPDPNGPGSHEIPRYVLRFRVPALAPGSYKYVLYCGGCVDGPRGTLIESGPAPPVRLRVVPPGSVSSFRALPWVLAGVAVAIALSTAVLLLRRHRVIAISHP